ncbi:hypothetical protein, variant [Exophiala mesophila]|nr:hypothetical protein, variant [Exophiala mesophila]KIV96595.1 hypothetical protein, variant [Exophiala mesophila]
MDSTLFRYFVNVVGDTMTPMSCRSSALARVIDNAMNEPYAMHSMLAVSACHYRYHRKSPMQKCLSENFHSMHACARLRRSLDMPQVDNVDAVVISTLFLGYLSFADTTEDFGVPLRQREVPFFWLRNQIGLESLVHLFQAKASIRKSSLGMFEDVADAILMLDDKKPATDSIPADLATLFDIREDSSSNDHPYLSALLRLRHLLALNPDNELAVVLYMQFMEGVSQHFLQLLDTLDPKALMLLSYWLALLCSNNCWWSRVRAKNECWAVCEHIDTFGDELLWKFMDFPANACGYPYSGTSSAGRDVVLRIRCDA